jgi:monoterpene epsilon-lactone hydrolase
MPSLKSRLVIFTVQHNHLFKGRLKRDVITRSTSTIQLRKEFEAGAKKFGSIPPDVIVSPVSIPGLPDGLFAEWIHPAVSANSPSAADKAIFYTHGGGYVTGNCIDHRMHVAKFGRAAGVGALLYDYRLAPEHPFPAAMQDTLTAYRWLLSQNVLPGNIIIVGESAGGGLCLASLLAIRDEGLPLPAAGVALSPWTDLKCTGDSYRRNAHRDISTLGSWDVWGSYYVGSNDPCHPWISPLYGDLQGLPPILIEVGDHEILLDDSRRFAEKARSANVDITLRVWEGMVHCFPLFAPMFPEATQAWEETIAYIKKHLGVN